MSEARRGQAHLGVAQAFADFAQHVAGRYPQVFEAQYRMAAGETAVERVHHALQDETRAVGIGEEHGGAAVFHARHDDGEAGAFKAGDQPLGAVDDVVVAVTHGSGGHQRRVGAGTVRLGHGEAGADVALHQRAQPALLLLRRGDHFHQVDVALVGGVDIHRGRAEGRVTGLLEDHRLTHVRQPEPAHFGRGMRRQQTVGAGLLDQLLAQFGVGTVRGLPRVALHRDDLFGDEAADLGLQGKQFVRHGEIHGDYLWVGLGHQSKSNASGSAFPTRLIF
ncbi:hypothetical protein D3C76_730570 [compost metagenome]